MLKISVFQTCSLLEYEGIHMFRVAMGGSLPPVCLRPDPLKGLPSSLQKPALRWGQLTTNHIKLQLKLDHINTLPLYCIKPVCFSDYYYVDQICFIW